jgi:leucine dehydrogenase
MKDELEQVLERWDGELTVVHRARTADAWMVIAVHSTSLGPTAGGCRMTTYPSLTSAVVDAHRLSSAMTAKFAVCDVPLGGGKSVIAVPHVPGGSERLRLLEEFGGVLATLRGLYSAAPDMNTSSADMDVIGGITEHVFCRSTEHGGSGSTAPATAAGVLHGIRATVETLSGSPDLAGRRIAVQGAGAVGSLLAARLREAGAEVALADVDERRARDVAGPLDAQVVPVGRILEHPCDVLAPCAVGGVLDAATVPRLACAGIAGAANNQLAEPAVAEMLTAAGILWAPDFVVNCGGVLHGAGLEVLGWTPDDVADRLRGIETLVRGIFSRADVDGVTTLAAAEAVVRERLTRRGVSTR